MSDILHKTIARYEIKDLIGEGAMAKVYRAYDPEIDRSVAFKVLKDDFCVDEEYLRRFLREAKAAGALSHSNIVTVFDVGKIDKSPYMMMELLEGRDLGDLLKEKKRLSIKETLIIGIQLAKALNYAHEAGVVHRDIKPDNIIVLPDGESIKVADFGIARINESDEILKTQVGSVLGTPRYMSPEQALGETVDGRSDLFSVGVILYEMLTGVKAFDGASMGTLMTQITQKQPPSLQQLCPGLPAGLRQTVYKLLQKKPERRFQTGAQLAAALTKELASVREQEEEQRKHKYVPLKVRLSIYMGAIVTVILLISMMIVFHIQSHSMTVQVVDAGESFAKFIATETAVPLLSEDWITLEAFINEAGNRETFSYLVVTDRNGIVRGASNKSLVGKPYKPENEGQLIANNDSVRTTSLILDNGQKVFNIRAPVLFQNTEVGQIVVGLSQNSLDQVKSVTSWLMFALGLVTVSSVVLVLFIFGGLIAKPLKALNTAMKGVMDGNWDTRISLSRDDEIGQLFLTFNKMANVVQKHNLAEPPPRAPNADQSATKPLRVNKRPVAKRKKKTAGRDVDVNGYDQTIIAATVIKSGPADVDESQDETIIALSSIAAKSSND
ncbi:protein kinase domain-containing protein [Gynuella sp.]|uniref:serine/threonine protein kinase n=1 Tax=Gynuella sp. TaxID=2969146 RepID=UPI003D0F6EB2